MTFPGFSNLKSFQTTGMGKLLYRLDAGRKVDVLYLLSASHQDVLNVDNISKAGR